MRAVAPWLPEAAVEREANNADELAYLTHKWRIGMLPLWALVERRYPQSFRQPRSTSSCCAQSIS
jgi:hypothetical protein